MYTTMGQILNSNNNNDISRVPYDENGDNGFIMCNNYIPEELIAEILCKVDYKSLLNCQLVCKKWNIILRDYVWRKKVELIIGQSILQSSKLMPWSVCYYLCKKKPIGRNLLKNNSGQSELDYWNITNQGGDHWKVESPPVGVSSLPENLLTSKINSCFVTSYNSCSKQQIINLVDEGLSPYLLDTLQPTVLVSEWYSSRWDCPAVYECNISLIGENNIVLDNYQYRDSIDGDEKQNIWHLFEHKFDNYGVGLRKIIFHHSGCDSLFWAGHYGSKMSGASVIIKLKSNKRDDNSINNEKLSSKSPN